MLRHAWNEKSVTRFLYYNLWSYLASFGNICCPQGYPNLACLDCFKYFPENSPIFDYLRCSLVTVQSNWHFNSYLGKSFFRRWLAGSLAFAHRHSLEIRIFWQLSLFVRFCSFLVIGIVLLVAETDYPKRAFSRCYRLNLFTWLGIREDYSNSCRYLIFRLVSCCSWISRCKAICWLFYHRTPPRQSVAFLSSDQNFMEAQ